MATERLTEIVSNITRRKLTKFSTERFFAGICLGINVFITVSKSEELMSELIVDTYGLNFYYLLCW